MFEQNDLIYSYSRAEAIADGVLVDVTETAKQAGIRFPTAITSAVWEQFVKVPEGVECQDEAGRLWDIVTMFAGAVRAVGGGSELRFTVHVRNDNRRPRPVTLKALCGPGDDAEPVLTIMLPNED